MSKPDDPGLSRRGFFKGVAFRGVTAGPPLLQLPHARGGDHYPAPGSTLLHYDFTKDSAALQPDQVIDSACQFCNSLCRLKVHLKAGRVIDVRGETEDPVQAGGLCVKGPMMAQLVYNRFRLTRPLKRVGGDKGSPDSKFEPVSWDEALET